MTIQQAVLAGFAMMAAAILIIGSSSAPQAQAQAQQFLFTSDSVSSPHNENKAFVAWRMNLATGAVSYCTLGSIATGPACSAWSK